MRICDIYFRRQLVLVVLMTILCVFGISKISNHFNFLDTTLVKEYKWEQHTRNERSYISDTFTLIDQQKQQEEKRSMSEYPSHDKDPSRCWSANTSPIGVSHEYLAHQPFSLPDDYIRPLKEILKEEWVCDLEDFLTTVDPKRRLVSIIAGNSNFTDPLLNWVIGATFKPTEPLTDWIVVSLDEPLYKVLKQRSIPSILVTPDSVMYTSQFPKEYHKHNGIYQARMIVMRLINHLGYDCANYDTDALILKNPLTVYDSPLFNDVDIFAGFAISFPPELHKLWGATLCNGAMMIKSNLHTELFWENVAMTPNHGCERGMDQCKFNYAFKRMNLSWTSTAESVTSFNADSVWRAHGDVEVMILPLRTICRQRFCIEKDMDKFYIWHKGSRAKTAEAKRESVEFGNLWWLRNDWQQISESSHLQGKDWIMLIANSTTIKF